MATVAIMLLKELLPRYGIRGPSDLGRRLGISRQHAWELWHGHIFPSGEMMQRLRGLGIAAEKLMMLERAEPPKKRGPRKRPPEPPTA